MDKINWTDCTAQILIVTGAINWGLIGIANFNLVEFLFPVDYARFVYSVVGTAGIYLGFKDVIKCVA